MPVFPVKVFGSVRVVMVVLRSAITIFVVKVMPVAVLVDEVSAVLLAVLTENVPVVEVELLPIFGFGWRI